MLNELPRGERDGEQVWFLLNRNGVFLVALVFRDIPSPSGVVFALGEVFRLKTMLDANAVHIPEILKIGWRYQRIEISRRKFISF